MEDLYTALGVSKTASADEIKKAYREAAFKYHPDRNPGDKAAEDKFKTINAAYAVLGDESKRREYDRYGSADAYANAWRGASQGGQQTSDSGDPFWDWFNNMQQESGETHTYTWYGPFGWQTQNSKQNRRPEPEPTKSQAFMSLVKNAVILCAGLFFFRFSWFIIPIGPILSIAAIFNGANGVFRSFKQIFQTKS